VALRQNRSGIVAVQAGEHFDGLVDPETITESRDLDDHGTPFQGQRPDAGDNVQVATGGETLLGRNVIDDQCRRG